MQNDLQLTHAALLWHTAHERRMSIGTEKRRLDKEIKAEGNGCLFSPLYQQQLNIGRQLTKAKRKELAALRLLAKACAKQRGHFDLADIIDLDGAITLLPGAE
ncbi:hypothetical protein [Janthinobacterium sp. 78]|uniref:hypothetical protein n=1 Tax=Janthinobacterium sp. 78 TaxID=2135631 RepID=UPI000D5DCE90|nr:hypothetical protein [Janthinobacterium sp. 78]PVX38200.1 hypothetical protein C8C92_4869 [Janthinobacterium sp. 78]